MYTLFEENTIKEPLKTVYFQEKYDFVFRKRKHLFKRGVFHLNWIFLYR